MKLGKTGIISFLVVLTMLLLLPVWAYGRTENRKELVLSTPNPVRYDGWIHNELSSNRGATSVLNDNYLKSVVANSDFVVEKDRTQVIPTKLLPFDKTSRSLPIQAKQLYLRPASPYELYHEENSGMRVKEINVYAVAPENTYPLVNKKRYRPVKRRFPLRESSKL